MNKKSILTRAIELRRYLLEAVVVIIFAVMAIIATFTNTLPQPVKAASNDESQTLATLQTTPLTVEQARTVYGNLPLFFEPNQGQVNNEQVKFTSRGNGYQMFLSVTEAVLSLHQLTATTGLDKQPEKNKIKLLKEKAKLGKQTVVRMQLIGANKEASSKGAELLEGKSNYFLGNDSAKWKTDVPNYKRVHFNEVYEGIDLEYYGNQKQLEYDFVVKPGADPRQIKLQFKGVDKVSVDKAGELILKTRLGEVRQKKPFIYQRLDDGTKQEIIGGYKVKGKKISFNLDNYDRTC